MINVVPHKVITEFDRNLADWHRGGPKPLGWTRTGPEIPFRPARLVGLRYASVSIDEALAKNPDETRRWHIDFLMNHVDVEDTAYYKEYLLPRYDVARAISRAYTFLELFDDIRANGVRQAVWVAECPWLGFPIFRFNGCHRMCAAKVLGATEVPALVFKAQLL